MERSLREALGEWCDWDGAAFALAVCLGLIEGRPGAFGRAKHVFWSDHPVGNVLYGMLDQLVSVGVLEVREEPDRQYRWNAAFRGSWKAGE